MAWGWRMDMKVPGGDDTPLCCSPHEEQWQTSCEAFQSGQRWFDEHPAYVVARAMDEGVCFREECDGVQFIIYGLGCFGQPRYTWNIDYIDSHGDDGLIDSSHFGALWPSRAEAARAGYEVYCKTKETLAKEAHRRNAAIDEGLPATLADGCFTMSKVKL